MMNTDCYRYAIRVGCHTISDGGWHDMVLARRCSLLLYVATLPGWSPDAVSVIRAHFNEMLMARRQLSPEAGERL